MLDLRRSPARRLGWHRSLDAREDGVEATRVLEELGYTLELSLLGRPADRVVQVEAEGLRRRELLCQLLRDVIRVCALVDLGVHRSKATALHPYGLRVGAGQIGHE